MLTRLNRDELRQYKLPTKFPFGKEVMWFEDKWKKFLGIIVEDPFDKDFTILIFDIASNSTVELNRAPEVGIASIDLAQAKLMEHFGETEDSIKWWTNIDNYLQKSLQGQLNKPDLAPFRKAAEKYYKLEKLDTYRFVFYEGIQDLAQRLTKSAFDENQTFTTQERQKIIASEMKHQLVRIWGASAYILILAAKGSSNEWLTPEFYGLQNKHNFEAEPSFAIHTWFRHHPSFHIYDSSESIEGGYQPDTFSNSLTLQPIQLAFMCLNCLDMADWRKARFGKDYLVDVDILGTTYTIARVGQTKRLRSFYPRKQPLESAIKLIRKDDSNEFSKVA